MHSTKNPKDGYLGSGRRIKAEIRKYGKENFKKEILEELPSRKALEEREAFIVNETLLSDPLCLNLKNGGEGGGKFWSKEHQLKCSEAGAKLGYLSMTKSLTSEQRSARSFAGAKACAVNETNKRWLGKKHTEESKKKTSQSMIGKNVGAKSAWHGTCWVTNNNGALRIKKEFLKEYLQNGYSRGRKFDNR